jgi:hypothetical protein
MLDVVTFVAVRPHVDGLFVKLWCKKLPATLANVGGVHLADNILAQVIKS